MEVAIIALQRMGFSAGMDYVAYIHRWQCRLVWDSKGLMVGKGSLVAFASLG